MDDFQATATHSEDATQRPLCRNCAKKLSKKGLFCPHCGEKNISKRIRMRDLLGKFFTHLVHLDSKFVRMVWQLLIPAKVTQAYFEGKTGRYPHPVQFFFIVMFFFLIVLGKSCRDGATINAGKNGEFNISSEKTAQHKKIRLDNTNIYDAMKRYAMALDLKSAYDSLPPSLKSENAKIALDSVIERVNGDWELALRMLQDEWGDKMDTIPFGAFGSEFRISLRDIAQKSPDEIITHYQVKNWWEQIPVRQGIKSIRDPQGLMTRYVGSFAWTALMVIAFMAAILKLLYWRQGRYYVEHFIFLMHQHAGAYLLLTFFVAAEVWIPWWPDAIIGLVLIWIAVALLIALKRYYGQKWPITVFKWLVYNFLLLLASAIFFTLSMLAVFALF
jgi:predicted RNA-binding Zn-ribbon protein involved in translation (DUF1610 family)